MNRRITIDYWWECEALAEEIPYKLADLLEESARERIIEMMQQGYTSGELNDYVNTDLEDHETPEDGWECRGWFTLQEVNTNENP